MRGHYMNLGNPSELTEEMKLGVVSETQILC